MTNDSFFALMCVSTLALFYGSVLAFAGYRFFLILLPIWGFIFGLGFGAQLIQAIFGTGFLSDITSWIVGFFSGLLFAAASYLFYFGAVAFLAGSLGYMLGVGFMGLIGIDFGFLSFLVGIVVGALLAVAVLLLNVQKWVIIIATALQGAGIITGTFLFMLGDLPTSRLVANPVRAALEGNPLWILIFFIIAGLGFLVQYRTGRNWQVDAYNRWDEFIITGPAEPMPTGGAMVAAGMPGPSTTLPPTAGAAGTELPLAEQPPHGPAGPGA